MFSAIKYKQTWLIKLLSEQYNPTSASFIFFQETKGAKST